MPTDKPPFPVLPESGGDALHDDIKRYQVHVLRGAGLTVKEVALKAGVSRSSVKRMLKEPTITSLDVAPAGRGPGRPGVARAFEATVRKILEAEPDLATVELLRRIGRLGYAGRKSAVYDLVTPLRPKNAEPIVRFEGVVTLRLCNG